MQRRQYCVYNQTSECFLSLGVTLGDSTFVRFRQLFMKGALRADEGRWFLRPKGLQVLGIFSARDLVYLDGNHKVIHVIEAFPAFRIAPAHAVGASVLALPAHTIYSSQTQPGNQLVICVAEEMEFRLRSIPDEGAEDAFPEPELETLPSLKSWLPQRSANDRRGAKRTRWPRLVAYDASGTALVVHGVRDISATGLYLMTEERWPMGTLVRMTLQRSDGLDDLSMQPITVQLKVTRWAHDGVGLEFVQHDTEHTALVAMHVR